MRIGIDGRLINQTGVGRYINNLIENLLEIDKKNEYVLFVRNQDYDQVKLKIKNLKFKIIKTNIKWHSLAEQIRFPKILEKENLDLVHFPYFSVPILYNKPFVVTIHDLIIHHFPTGKASTLPSPIYWSKILAYKYVISKAAQKAKKIITVSNSTRDEIVDHLKIPANKVDVIYEGVESAFRNQRQASSLRITKRSELNANRYFLFVGNVYPHKNAETLIKAFNILISKYHNISLVFVGKEDYFYKRLKKRVKGVKEIEFLSDLNDEELSWFYQNAITTVCPAFMEGFGLPALEAMANKCLVLASDIPALREVCKDNAIYFNPEDPQELSGKMKQVLSNKEKYKGLVEKGFNRSQEFSWRKMAKETLEVYNHAVS